LDTDRAVHEIVESAPSLVILTSPNNPSGTSTGIAVIEQLARATAQAGSLFIVDEAYAEFSQERSAVTLISQFPHLVVARTMSKAFAFAGARVGYLVASPEVVDAALVTRLPYHLGSLTQAAAEVAIDHAPIMQQGLKELMSERDRLASAVSDVGWRSLESSGNFLLITGFSDSSTAVWKKFLDRGVLIRDIGLEGYVRVTVGRPQENTQFIAALREIAQ
jgi:histidinol-phosphate aminotransferase